MYRRRGKEREKEVEGEEIRPKQDIRVYERRRGQAASKEGDRQIMGKGVTELASGSVGEEERAAGIRPMDLTRRPLPSCYAYQVRILPGPLPGDGCGSCAPT